MSDIAQNGLRYNPTNTARSDCFNSHNGQVVSELKPGGVVIGFDCSGFVCHVIIESGYRIDYDATYNLITSKAFSSVSDNNAQSGDIILFDGHVGIVTEYDPSTALGKFIHMSGNSKKGGVLKLSYFVSNEDKYRQLLNQTKVRALRGPDNNTIIYGTSRPVIALRRVNTNRYSADVDLHVNGSNPYPTLRTLGTTVYSDHIRKTQKRSKSTKSKKNKNLPSTKDLQYENVPHKDGSFDLIKRMFGNLPDFDLG